MKTQKWTFEGSFYHYSILNREEDEDDIDEVLMLLTYYRKRKRNRARRLNLVSNLLKILYGGNRGDNRVAMTGFTEIVWRYSDIQFPEDFRMTRERFGVKKN